MIIGIINYGAGNIRSIFNTLFNLGYDPLIINKTNNFKNIDILIIPGVGSAFSCIKFLENSGLKEKILEFNSKKKPIIGICLGMQILCKNLYEGGNAKGFEFFDANVTRLEVKKKINIGWEKVKLINKKNLIFEEGLYYFCHSYYVKFNNQSSKDIIATTNLGFDIPSIIRKENIIGLQFHPEKSQAVGKRLLLKILNQLKSN